MNTQAELRRVVEQVRAQRASDGDGVQLLRVFGGTRPERFDPFLMLDEFGSCEASDYIGGFPSHPHRGFETVTYMLEGKMEHRDHLGNVGLINDSDVQWMTAGRGIIHSEMPRQTQGRMRGFQLWVNLPAANKMKPAHYQDVSGDKIPKYDLEGLTVKAIAGATEVQGQSVSGYFQVPDTAALFLDVHIEPEVSVDIAVPDAYTALVYTYEGEVALGDQPVPAPQQTLTRFNDSGALRIAHRAGGQARVIVLAGKPLREPIVQHGPFVMNTAAEIETAITDYQYGRLTG